MSYNVARAGLETRLLTTPGIPAVVLPNRLPTANLIEAMYIQAQFAPATKEIATVGPNPQQRYEGGYMMMIMSPTHVGEGAALALADTLVARFPPSTSFQHGVLYIGITKSKVRPSYEVNSKLCTPVVVDWFTYA